MDWIFQRALFRGAVSWHILFEDFFSSFFHDSSWLHSELRRLEDVFRKSPIISEGFLTWVSVPKHHVTEQSVGCKGGIQCFPAVKVKGGFLSRKWKLTFHCSSHLHAAADNFVSLWHQAVGSAEFLPLSPAPRQIFRPLAPFVLSQFHSNFFHNNVLLALISRGYAWNTCCCQSHHRTQERFQTRTHSREQWLRGWRSWKSSVTESGDKNLRVSCSS